MRIGLALSGGGLRATLYHLGVIRYLKECGLLSSISHITSVSGGSILGAHLVLNWERYLGSRDEMDEACQEILDFVNIDTRNRILRRYPFALACGFVQRTLRQRPSRWVTRAGLLEKQYRDFLFGDTCLHQLPVKPELHILCTNLSEGGLSSFTRSGLLFEERTKSGKIRMRRHRAGLATIPMAVAASSAFPGFFPPLEVTAEDIGATDGEFQTQFFTDGGVYDNLGVRMFKYLECGPRTELRPESFENPEIARQVWNEAAVASNGSPLSRIAQLGSNGSGHQVHTATPVSLVATTSEMISTLQEIISSTDLNEDEHLRNLLEMDRFPVQNDDLGTRLGNRFGQKSATPDSRSDPHNRLVQNRHLLGLAFRQAAGRELLSEQTGGFDMIIASDAGKKFQSARPDRTGSFLGTAIRSSDILMDRVWQLEKAHFEKSTDYVFVPITQIVPSQDGPTTLHPEVQVQIAKIRTDLDRFNNDEVDGLVQHGYAVARHSISSRLKVNSPTGLDVTGNGNAPANNGSPMPSSTKSYRGAVAAQATQTARRLQASSRRKYLGRFLSYRDWVSYLYLPILIAIFGLVPYWVYCNWRHGHVASTLTTAIAESRHDYKKLLDLMKFGPVEPWQGMPFEETTNLTPLFAEKGLDIITDSQVVDLRHFDHITDGREPQVYVYRSVSVRKVQHARGTTALRLQSLWDMPEIHVRCHNPELSPILKRCDIVDEDSQEKRYGWQLSLDFSRVPVGHTTEVIVETLLPTEGGVITSHGRPWWQFEVDADPEVATSWLLLPETWSETNPRLVRFHNESPELLEFVEPTHRASIASNSILHWIIVHPKEGYTYTYQWDAKK